MMLDGLHQTSAIGEDLTVNLVVELAGRFKVPVPEVKFTCLYSHRGWYHYPECECGCKAHPHGSIRVGRQSRMVRIVLHEFAHHLVRHKLSDWETIAAHGWDFKRYLDQAFEAAYELGMMET